MDADFFADLDFDALLASFSGEPAVVSDLIIPSSPPPAPPARDAEAGSPESVTSRSSPPAEALSEIERFLMEEGEAEGDGAVEGIGVEEFFDALYDGGEEKGKESEAGGSTDSGSGREEEVVTPEAEKVEVDGDDPVSKKKRRYVYFDFSLKDK